VSGLREGHLAAIEEVGDSWTQEEKDLARLVAEDYADLTLRQLKGGDVGEELGHVKAQAMAIGAAATVSAAAVFWERVEALSGGMIASLKPWNV